MLFNGRQLFIKCGIASLLVFIMSCTSSNEPRLIVQTQTIQDKYPDVYEYDLPETMTLCGETIDLSDPMVREMFDREFTITVWDRPQVFMWLKRSGRYFPYFEKVLAERGLPDDLKYLAVAESSLHTHVKSRAGASGMWQFMEPAASRFGLRVEKGVMDERLCYERSTDAALQYLKILKGDLDSWLLAMAAYNCGENMVNQSRKSQNISDYFKLNLPQETERYIFRIAVIKHVMENHEKYGYKLDPKRVYKPFEYTKVKVNVAGRFYITDLAQVSGFSYKEFRELNPKVQSSTLPQGRYTLNIPSGYGDKFVLALEKLSDASFRKKYNYGTRYYVVKSGDVLSGVSWRTGVSMTTLRRLNNMKGWNITPGQTLLIRE